MNVGIIGSGTMGSGIAQVAATAGFHVKLYDTNQAFADADCDWQNLPTFTEVELRKTGPIVLDKQQANMALLVEGQSNLQRKKFAISELI